MDDKMERVAVYVDGFNLYFGMTSTFKNVKWLNIEELAKSLLKNNQELSFVKYFTSMVANNPPKEKRQRTYIRVPLKQQIYKSFTATISQSQNLAIGVIIDGKIIKKK